MKVLVACEFSGTVRDAFRIKGHDAWSCDLLPCEIPGPHIQGDVLEIIGRGWDLMIAHPPCTHLAVSGARYFKQKRESGEQQRAIDFFLALYNAPIPKKCIENPVCIMSSIIGKPNQIIQPWMFGHNESKKTCLWLKNLPNLIPTRVIGGPSDIRDNQTPSGQNRLPPSKDRWKIRSKTYDGIAKAMADQWG